MLLIGAAGTVLISDDPGAEWIGTDQLGWILLVTGLIGLALSLIFWSSWGGFRRVPATAGGGVRTPIFAVGLALTSLITYAAIHIVAGMQYEKPPVSVLAYALAAPAIGVPFLGAVAAARAEQWKPLIPGCVLGIAADTGIWVLLQAT